MILRDQRDIENAIIRLEKEIKDLKEKVNYGNSNIKQLGNQTVIGGDAVFQGSTETRLPRILALSSGGEPTDADANGAFVAEPGYVFDGKTYNMGNVKNGALGAGFTDDGEITANAGTIGGFTIGADTIQSANYVADTSGVKLTGSTGNIEVNNAKIGGWNIDNAKIQSANYVAGQAGAKMSGATGDAEFNNIKARGAIVASVFEKGQVTATSGTQGWFKSAGKLKLTCYVNTAPTSTEIDMDDPDSGHAALFAVNDIVRLKSNAGDCWIKITSVSDQTTYYAYYGLLQSGTAVDFDPGTVVVNYGISGDGFLWATADDTNAPFFAVYTHAGSPWSVITEVARFGNLNGALTYASDLYGIAIGDTTGYMKYDPTNGFTVGFAGGGATIGADGIKVDGQTMVYDHTAELDDATGDKRLRMGVFPHPNRDDMLVSGFKHSGAFKQLESTGTIVEGELLGTNRGFELGTLDQFTLTRTPSSGSIVPVYALTTASPIAGTYSLSLKIKIVDHESETETFEQSHSLITGKVAVTAGNNVTFSVKSKGVTYNALFVASQIFHIRAYFYDAANNIVAYETITTTRPTSTTRTDTATFVVPAGATQCAIKVYMYGHINTGTGGYLTWTALYDDFSINGESVQAGTASWNEVQREQTLFLHRGLHYVGEDGNLYKVVMVKQGIQAPGALTATATATAGNVDIGTHSYKVTFVDDYGETEASAKSNVITVSGSAKQVNLTAIPKGKDGTRTRKIYRTVAGDTGDWLFLTEIMDNTTTTYTDNTADANLGTAVAPGVNTSGSRPYLPDSWFGAFTQFRAFHSDGTEFEPTSGRSLSNSSIPSGVSLLPGAEAADGDYYICNVLLAPGTYTWLANYAKNTSFGKVDLYFDGVKVNSTTLDMYASSASYANDWSVTGITVSSYMLHEIKLVINGKNASSSDYRIQMGAMSMNRTA